MDARRGVEDSRSLASSLSTARSTPPALDFTRNVHRVATSLPILISLGPTRISETQSMG